MQATELAPNLFLLEGAVNTGVLVSGRRALLYDCCDTVTPERLAPLGVERVDTILCTQHRRANVAGAYSFAAAGARLVAPAAEQHLFEDVEAYWRDWRNRWHLYHHQPGPQVLARPLPVGRAVSEGDAIAWEGYTIRVLETPGATEGSVSYQVAVGGAGFCFCGDVLYGPGQVWDVYSLQKGFGGVRDYHGFLGQRPQLLASLHKLGECGADVLVPSHGAPAHDPKAATALTAEHLDTLWRNYCAISALNHYFPGLLAEGNGDPRRLAPADMRERPPFIRRVAYTSDAILSDSGAALLIDCGHDLVVDTLAQWLAEGTIRAVEGCWVTHYHDDHVDALGRLAATFGCPIIADRHLAEILEHPMRFFLPCISPNPAPVTRVTGEGETWQWHEFRLTAFHLPGQSLYHGGLLVEGHGRRILFAGDSGAPTGLDDYCAGNRNLLGPDRGFRHCIALWRRYRPDAIINQHQEQTFCFSPEALDEMDRLLAERERLLAGMLPWAHPDFGTDEHWLRSYPYQQEAAPGVRVPVEMRFTNHGPEPAAAVVAPVLPAGWQAQGGAARAIVAPKSAGLIAPGIDNPDGAVRVWVSIPAGAAAGRYIVPFCITWDGRYLGQLRHTVIDVRA